MELSELTELAGLFVVVDRRLVLSVFVFASLIIMQQPTWADQTVGNAAATPIPAGAQEPYGVTSAFSTHQRLGDATGIGGSYLGTESVTSESRSAPSLGHLQGATAPEVRNPRLHMPTGIESPSASPSLADPSLTTTGGRALMTPGFRVRPQSTPNFSFAHPQSPALKELKFGGSDYSLEQFK